MSSKKEEIAARIRSLLGVEIQFEKLKKDELELLLSKLEDVLKKEEKTQDTSVKMFPLGIIPYIADRVKSRVDTFINAMAEKVPEMRQEIMKRVDALIDETIRKFFEVTKVEGEKGKQD